VPSSPLLARQSPLSTQIASCGCTSQISPSSPPPFSLTLAPSSSRHPSSSTNDSSQRVIATQSSSLPASATTPTTSHSFTSSSSSLYDPFSSADTQVGIGLSLLQDLANGMTSTRKPSSSEQHLRLESPLLYSPPMPTSSLQPPPQHHLRLSVHKRELRPSLAPSANVLSVLCQCGIWGCANTTSTGIMTEN